MNVRWYIPTPGKLVAGLLAFELCLVAIDRHSGWLCLAGAAAVVLVVLTGLIWFGIALLSRRRFQFGIRTLLTLMVVVAVVGGWFSWRREKAREQREAGAAILKLGGWGSYDCALPPWPRNVVGYDFLASVNTISLRDTQTADAGLEHLRGFTQLSELDLACTQVTDAGLEHLKGMTQLKELNLDCTQVTDAGLEHLKGMTQLSELDLARTQVTDAGLEHLTRMTQLWRLDLSGTRVTNEGSRKLQKALPNCSIVR
jgi:hypothetical protein